MTEKEFIEQYVAQNTNMIVTGIEKHGLSREQMVREMVASAKASWAILQQSLSEQPEQEPETPETAWIEQNEIVNDTIFVGVPNDVEDCGYRKVIFCPMGHFDRGVYVRFALFDECGDYKMMVTDKAAGHAVSYRSNECVCMAKHCAGINFDALPEMHFRLPSADELKLLDKIIVSCGISLAADNTFMRNGLDGRKIN